LESWSRCSLQRRSLCMKSCRNRRRRKRIRRLIKVSFWSDVWYSGLYRWGHGVLSDLFLRFESLRRIRGWRHVVISIVISVLEWSGCVRGRGSSHDIWVLMHDWRLGHHRSCWVLSHERLNKAWSFCVEPRISLVS